MTLRTRRGPALLAGNRFMRASVMRSSRAGPTGRMKSVFGCPSRSVVGNVGRLGLEPTRQGSGTTVLCRAASPVLLVREFAVLLREAP